MFSIRYAGDIQSRKSQSISSATARTLAELPSTLKIPQKKSNQKFLNKPTTPPQSFDEAFPPALPSSNSNEIDEAILLDLHNHFLEGEYIFQNHLVESQSFYNCNQYISPQDELDFLEFHFLNDSGWYQECPECLLNFLTDCGDDDKCNCHIHHQP